MNRAIIVVLMLNLFITICYAQEKPNAAKFKQGSEPNGFRGIEWNTDIDTIKEKKGLVFHGMQGPFEAFVIRNDNMEIGDANLSVIGYLFWNGRFCKVDIMFTSFSDHEKLRKQVFNTFGPAQKTKYLNEDRYIWEGEKTTMFLSDFDKKKKMGGLIMFSNEMINKIDQYMKKNSAKGSGSGF